MTKSQLPKVPENISFASELIKARAGVELTQAQLSEKSGVSLSAIKGYETGRTMPGARELRELCQALEISPNKLLFGTETPFKADTFAPLFSTLEAEDKYLDRFQLGLLAALMTFDERKAVYTLMQGLVVARHGEARVRELLSESEKSMHGLTEKIDAAMNAIQEEQKFIRQEQKMKAKG